MAFTILWRRQSKPAAILAPVMGFATGIAVWLGTAHHFAGSVSVAATGEILPCVYGTVASACSPILYSVVITAIRPQNYDWTEFSKEKLALENLDANLTTVHHEHKETASSVPSSDAGDRLEDGPQAQALLEAKDLKRWGRIAAFWSIATFLGHWVIWPLPMYGSKYVFERKVCLHHHCCYYHWTGQLTVQ